MEMGTWRLLDVECNNDLHSKGVKLLAIEKIASTFCYVKEKLLDSTTGLKWYI